MELNLAGKTVTQSISMVRQALAEQEGDELMVKTDNETVKLNLLSQVHRLGLRCKAERRGPFHFIKIELDRKAAASMPTEGGGTGGLKTDKVETTAFPVSHLGGRKTETLAQASPPPRRRRRLLADDTLPGSQKVAMQPPPETLPKQPLPQAASHKLSWLVIQSDQVGQRDTQLGCELLEELLESLDPKKVAGIFLVHRGVRLLDPSYFGGRLYTALTRKNLNIMACERSLRFYGIEDRGIKSAPFHQLPDLAAAYDLIWI